MLLLRRLTTMTMAQQHMLSSLRKKKHWIFDLDGLLLLGVVGVSLFFDLRTYTAPIMSLVAFFRYSHGAHA